MLSFLKHDSGDPKPLICVTERKATADVIAFPLKIERYTCRDLGVAWPYPGRDLGAKQCPKATKPGDRP